MLSLTGLSGVGQTKQKVTVGGAGSFLAPPPSGAGKLRSALPPPPNDPAVAKISQKASLLAPPHENPDPFSDLSSVEVSFFVFSFSNFSLFLYRCDGL